MAKRFLITGGAGYIGTELVKKFVQMKQIEEIIVYDNLSKGAYNFFLCTCIGGDNIRFIQGDILDTRKLRKALQGVDVVIHAAAKIATPYSDDDPHKYEQINHWGTAELSYAIEESNVQRLIHISSLSVYGASGKNKLITESTKLNPRTNYGISKMRGEAFIERLMKKIPTYIIRLGNVYGFNQSMRFDAVINRFAFDANFVKKLDIHGDGRQERSFIHVDKAADDARMLGHDVVEPGEVAERGALALEEAVAAVVVERDVVEPSGVLDGLESGGNHRGAGEAADRVERRERVGPQPVVGKGPLVADAPAVGVAQRSVFPVGVVVLAAGVADHVAGVVDDDVEVDAQAARVGGAQEGGVVLVGAEVRVDVEKVVRPVAVVTGGAGLDGIVAERRHRPERGDVEALEIVELAGEPRKIPAMEVARAGRLEAVVLRYMRATAEQRRQREHGKRRRPHGVVSPCAG